MRATLPLLALCLVGSTACADPAVLVVDLRTDLRPRIEFDDVVVEAYPGAGAGALDVPARVTAPRPVRDEVDPAAGLRVAELRGLAPGDWYLRVGLRRRGQEVAHGLVAVRLERRPHAVTVIVTRDCRGLSCPAAGGDPSHLACVAGRCVDPRCSGETPEHCGPSECARDADCVPEGPACMAGACLEGVCFDWADDARCGDDAVCDPQLGCASAPPELDGGPPAVDGGAPDAGAGGWSTDGWTLPGSGDVFIVGAAATSTGDVVLAGRFVGDADLGDGARAAAGGSEAFAARYRPDGTPVWVRLLGPAPYVNAVQAGAGRVFVGATVGTDVDYDAVLRVLDEDDGAPLWDAVVASPGPDHVSAIAADERLTCVAGKNGGALRFDGTPPAPEGDSPYAACWSTANGDLLWGRDLPGPGDATTVALLAPHGTVVIGGAMLGSFTFAGATIGDGAYRPFALAFGEAGEERWGTHWSQGSRALLYDPSRDRLFVGGGHDDGVAIGGVEHLPPSGEREAFVLELDPRTGAGIAARALGAEGRRWVDALALTDGALYATTGRRSGGLTVLRLDREDLAPLDALPVGLDRAVRPSGMAFVGAETLFVVGALEEPLADPPLSHRAAIDGLVLRVRR